MGKKEKRGAKFCLSFLLLLSTSIRAPYCSRVNSPLCCCSPHFPLLSLLSPSQWRRRRSAAANSQTTITQMKEAKAAFGLIRLTHGPRASGQRADARGLGRTVFLSPRHQRGLNGTSRAR